MTAVAALAALLLPGAARAEEAEGALSASAPDAWERPPRQVVAVPANDAAITVDGVLDEPAWASAARIDGFARNQPEEGGPTTGAVEVRLMAGPRALEVAFIVTDDPSKVRAHVAARESEPAFADDLMSILLDPWMDGRQLLEFGVTPLGIQFDGRVTEDDFDISFDAAWDSKGRLTPTGYVVELSIPFSSLRFSRAETQRWAVTFERRVARNNEQMVWPPRRAAWGPRTSQTAVLDGIRVPRRRTHVELWPSAVVGYGTSSVDPEDPAAGLEWAAPRWWELVQPGLGVRWLMTRNLVLDLTLNPDYSQIEADPFQVDANLRYPIQLEERRPFFQEGREHLDSPDDLLYSRILSDPLAGLKVTGKEGRVGIGLLQVLDLAPSASLVTEDVEAPVSGYGESGTATCPTPGFCAEDLPGKAGLSTVAQLTVDVGPGSVAGVAYAEKDLIDVSHTALDGLLGQPWEGSEGAEGGADPRDAVATNRVVSGFADVRFARVWRAHGFLTGSFTRSDDASLDGFGYYAEVGRQDRHLGVEAGAWGQSPGLRKENAYFTSGDEFGGFAGASYRFEPGREALKSFEPGVAGWAGVDSAGTLRTAAFETWSSLEGARRSSFGTYYTFQHQRYSGEDFRFHHGSLSFTDQPASGLALRVRAYGGQQIYYDPSDPFLGASVGGSVALMLRPVAAVVIAPEFREEAFWAPDGRGLLYHQEVVRLREEFAFSQAWSLRAIQEWNSLSREVRASLLVTWLRWPGTAVYAGVSAGFAYPEDHLVVSEFQVFLKGSYVARL